MSYIMGMAVAVEGARQAEYRAHAASTWDFFKSLGALRMVEAWGETVPEGTKTSFPAAVQLAPGEVVVLSWVEWPDRDAFEKADAAMRAGDADDVIAELPFDTSRMIWGGFDTILDLSVAAGD